MTGGTRGRSVALVIPMRLRQCFAVALVAAFASSSLPGARVHSVVEWLDTYAAGHHDRVVTALAGDVNFDDVLKQLRRDGPAWIAAGGTSAVERRTLTAATVALEAARIGAGSEWKLTQRQPRICEFPEPVCQPLNVLYWKAPPQLIEWGCSLLRKHPEPGSAERWWQLAALAAAQRAEDPQFLVGDTNIGKGVDAGEIINTQDEIKHLDHVQKRFPDERRFLLGQGIARDRDWPEDAVQAYHAIAGDIDVGGEALMRLGAMQMRMRRPEEALRNFERSLELTRDPYVVFLAHYYSGRIYQQQPNLPLAESAFRRAAAAVPHAQSATVSLAALLAQDGRRSEAHQLVRDMLAANPRPADPWRRFVHADDRFWPLLIARLRAEIAR